MQKRYCLTYTSPTLAVLNKSAESAAAIEEYTERLSFIDEDLTWLLSLPYQLFLCQMIYDEACLAMVDSYLRLAPR